MPLFIDTLVLRRLQNKQENMSRKQLHWLIGAQKKKWSFTEDLNLGIANIKKRDLNEIL